MVSSTITDEERESWNTVFKLGFILIVSGSATLIALQGNATPLQLGLVAVVGALFGWLLLRYLLWAGKRSSTSDRGKRRRFK